jgi:hypothetical protein
VKRAAKTNKGEGCQRRSSAGKRASERAFHLLFHRFLSYVLVAGTDAREVDNTVVAD